MYMLVHERNAPNNAFSIKTILYRHIQRLGIEFFHPKWPSEEEKGDFFADGEEEFPIRIGKLEADLRMIRLKKQRHIFWYDKSYYLIRNEGEKKKVKGDVMDFSEETFGENLNEELEPF